MRNKKHDDPMLSRISLSIENSLARMKALKEPTFKPSQQKAQTSNESSILPAFCGIFKKPETKPQGTDSAVVSDETLHNKEIESIYRRRTGATGVEEYLVKRRDAPDEEKEWVEREEVERTAKYLVSRFEFRQAARVDRRVYRGLV